MKGSKANFSQSAGKQTSVAYNGKKLSSVANLSVKWSKLEHLYARENELSDFDPPEPCPNLHTLDLSLNTLSGSLNFLSLVRNLKHLYVAGNGLTSLAGLSDLPHLESIFASNNDISSLDGLGHLPALRTLALFDNDITNLKFFPHLPSLYSLALAGNPVSTSPHYRALCVAVCADSLGVIDTGEVTPLERAAVRRSFTGKVAFAATEGFVPSIAATDADALAVEAGQFHLDLRTAHTENMALKAAVVELVGSFKEGEPVRLLACLIDRRTHEARRSVPFQSTALPAVNFKVTGEAEAVEVVGSMTEWRLALPLDRVEREGSVFFQGSVHVPPGEYEYRYSVDGVEKVSKQMPTATTESGECNMYQVAHPADPPVMCKNFIYVRWLRTVSTNGFESIEGAHGTSYTPTADDVGRCLRCEVVVYEENVYAGMFFDISPPILVGSPTFSTFTMVPSLLTQGMPSCLKAIYAGGKPAREALRAEDVSAALVAPDGSAVAIPPERLKCDSAGGAIVFEPTGDDVGKRLRLSAVPIREDEVRGRTVVFESDIIAPAVPQCVNMSAPPPFVEGIPIVVSAQYQGGVEGDSVLQWNRATKPGMSTPEAIRSDFVAIEGANSLAYTPTVEDVGYRLALNYRPVRDDGVAGEMARFVTEVVHPAAPDISNLRLVGPSEEGAELRVEYSYKGGVAGEPLIQWVRSAAVGREMVGTGDRVYVPVAEDVGCYIAVTVVPRRADGVTGTAAIAFTSTPVRAGPPRFASVNVHGVAEEGSTVRVVANYAGGNAGAHVVAWEVKGEDGVWTQCRPSAASVPPMSHVCTLAETHKLLRAVVTPLRDDGVQGEGVSVEVGVVRPSAPRVTAVHIAPSGGHHFRVGQPLTASFSYVGGHPGAHRVEWSRRTPLGEVASVLTTTVPVGAAATSYVPVAADVLCYLAAVVTPVRDDGTEGSPLRSAWTPAVQAREGSQLTLRVGVREGVRA